MYGNRYWSKNTGAVCYLICLGLLTLEDDIEIVRNNEGFVVLSFVPTNQRMDAFRNYVKAFRERTELSVDIVKYNSIFGSIKREINSYKLDKGIK